MLNKRLIKTTIKQGEPIPEDLEIIQVIEEVVVGRENWTDIIMLNVWALEAIKS